MATKVNFMREAKEQGLLKVQWRSGDTMSSDLFTKNLGGPLFEKHTAVYCGVDEYMATGSKDSQGESVGGDKITMVESPAETMNSRPENAN